MARYVVTDTFHGSIFSIIMQTPFCTIIRDTNSEKLTALLDIMSLKDRRANESTDIDRLFYKEISFDEAKERIQIERKATKGYLAKNLFNK